MLAIIISLLVGIGPFVGYWLALRRPDRTRVQIVSLSAVGAGLPMAVLCATWAAEGQPSLDLVPWMVAALGYGTLIGIAGIVARLVGAWLSRRQP